MSFQIAALAGSAILSAGAQVASGYAQARAHRGQAGQYASQQQELKVQTQQEEVARRRRLFEMTGANAADLAFRDVTSDSGSYEAIEAENRRLAELDISNVRYMGEQKIRRLGLAAHLSNKAASSAITGGWINAGATLLGAAWQGYRSMQGTPGTGGSNPATMSYGSPSGGPPGGW